MIFERLQDNLSKAEKEGSNLHVDQIAFLVGNFPLGHDVRTMVSGKYPRIEAILETVSPLPSETHALLQLSSFINDENIVGSVAEGIRKLVRP